MGDLLGRDRVAEEAETQSVPFASVAAALDRIQGIGVEDRERRHLAEVGRLHRPLQLHREGHRRVVDDGLLQCEARAGIVGLQHRDTAVRDVRRVGLAALGAAGFQHPEHLGVAQGVAPASVARGGGGVCITRVSPVGLLSASAASTSRTFESSKAPFAPLLVVHEAPEAWVAGARAGTGDSARTAGGANTRAAASFATRAAGAKAAGLAGGTTGRAAARSASRGAACTTGTLAGFGIVGGAAAAARRAEGGAGGTETTGARRGGGAIRG